MARTTMIRKSTIPNRSTGMASVMPNPLVKGTPAKIAPTKFLGSTGTVKPTNRYTTGTAGTTKPTASATTGIAFRKVNPPSRIAPARKDANASGNMAKAAAKAPPKRPEPRPSSPPSEKKAAPARSNAGGAKRGAARAAQVKAMNATKRGLRRGKRGRLIGIGAKKALAAKKSKKPSN